MTLRDILTQAVNGVLNLTLKDCLTLALAAYGAGLSSYLAWFDRRPKLRLSASINFVFQQGVDGTDEPILTCTIRNIGRVPVTIDNWGFQLLGPGIGSLRRKRRSVVCPRHLLDAVTFPHELAAGKRCSVGVWAKDFAEHLEEDGVCRACLVPLCVDQTGKEHRGTRAFFTIDDLNRPYRFKPDGTERKSREWRPFRRRALAPPNSGSEGQAAPPAQPSDDALPDRRSSASA